MLSSLDCNPLMQLLAVQVRQALCMALRAGLMSSLMAAQHSDGCLQPQVNQPHIGKQAFIHCRVNSLHGMYCVADMLPSIV